MKGYQLVFLLLLGVNLAATGQEIKKRKLVFSDEFSVQGLPDSTKMDL
ncbi:hypothetical protein HDE69_002826 [Pedobacter cryoconitis]|uniref:Uncharacterized protein n=1 Tax=Pedobacter cryoconitis TaxID=188932 RepID=A0A7W8YUC3_9SPHI|nr:hypothetical protein [Pedobacter cryoconitis]